jgi:hypothetical protein
LCALDIDPTGGWHSVHGSAAWDGATGAGTCTLFWDGASATGADASFLRADGTVLAMERVIVGGSAPSGISGESHIGYDELCIGATSTDCPEIAPLPDGGVTADGGSTPPPSGAPPYTFRGGGGCVCAIAAPRSARPLRVAGALVAIGGALLARARWRRRMDVARISREVRSLPPRRRS